jgi:hypothetical protein
MFGTCVAEREGMKTTQINISSALTGSQVSIHHPAGLTVVECHAAAKLVPCAVIRETFKQTNGTISSFGYMVKA